MNVDSSELRSSNGWIYAAKNPSKKIRFAEARDAIGSEVIVGKGSRAPNPGPGVHSRLTLGTRPQDGVSFATFGASAVEVEVDIETGEVHVLRAATAHEFGRALNPKFCDSQHYGGIVMGIGFALMEESVLDKKTGIMLKTDFHQYRMATAGDMPLEIIPFNIEGEDKFFAYSAKGGGEAVNTGTAPAIRNAIYNAIHVWIDEYPITSARILDALEKKGAN
jgi:CO/xanthine dehydrogenase Mo-binding subunit